MKCAWGCTTYNPLCDMCDEESNDPDTGFGGFTDHRLGKHFMSENERRQYVVNCHRRGVNPEHRDEIED